MLRLPPPPLMHTLRCSICPPFVASQRALPRAKSWPPSSCFTWAKPGNEAEHPLHCSRCLTAAQQRDRWDGGQKIKQEGILSRTLCCLLSRLGTYRVEVAAGWHFGDAIRTMQNNYRHTLGVMAIDFLVTEKGWCHHMLQDRPLPSSVPIQSQCIAHSQDWQESKVQAGQTSLTTSWWAALGALPSITADVTAALVMKETTLPGVSQPSHWILSVLPSAPAQS